MQRQLQQHPQQPQKRGYSNDAEFFEHLTFSLCSTEFADLTLEEFAAMRTHCDHRSLKDFVPAAPVKQHAPRNSAGKPGRRGGY